jgi:hypothetical protein
MDFHRDISDSGGPTAKPRLVIPLNRANVRTAKERSDVCSRALHALCYLHREASSCPCCSSTDYVVDFR